MSQFESISNLQKSLEAEAYIVDEGLATALFLAQSLGQQQRCG